MSDATARLVLPLLAPAQAQKHVTHNEALVLLDAVVQLSVEERRSSPPASLIESARYIVAAGPTDAFAGHAGDVAAVQDGTWLFFQPAEGWVAWVAAESAAVVYHAGAWSDLKPRSADALDIGTHADPVNRLAVGSEGVLLTHDGDDCRLKINKAASGDTASLVFQNAYSGRAEMGLAGDDRFRVKISADGIGWSDILVADPATARLGIGTGSPAAKLDVDGPIRCKAFAVGGLPPAGAGSGQIVMVSDETGGAVLAFSDGSVWRRVTDRAVVS